MHLSVVSRIASEPSHDGGGNFTIDHVVTLSVLLDAVIVVLAAHPKNVQQSEAVANSCQATTADIGGPTRNTFHAYSSSGRDNP